MCNRGDFNTGIFIVNHVSHLTLRTIVIISSIFFLDNLKLL